MHDPMTEWASRVATAMFTATHNRRDFEKDPIPNKFNRTVSAKKSRAKIKKQQTRATQRVVQEQKSRNARKDI